MHAFLLFCPSSLNSDGLYVLLRPIAKKGKKNKGAPNQPADLLSHPSIPSNLVDYVMNELPAGTCPWGISGGPQFPRPTAIQKRYCYPKVCIWCYLFSFISFSAMIQRWPRFLTLTLAFVILHILLPTKGGSEYSSRKAGAIWTMCLDNGKEDLEYRLFHVYVPAKRTVNKGIEVRKDMASSKRRPPSPPKHSLPDSVAIKNIRAEIRSVFPNITKEGEQRLLKERAQHLKLPGGFRRASKRMRRAKKKL